jgi:phage FluMu protein Com
MRCKICGKTSHVQRQAHSWTVAQHCPKCHFMGRIPSGVKHKNYAKW